MRLPDRILNTACFFAYKEEKPRYGGTGFVAAVRGIHGNAYLYLVTAKHVAEKLEACPFIVGFNHKDGSKAEIDADEVKWYYHPTEPNAVDAAVTPFAPTQYNLLDLELVPEEFFTTPEVIRKACIGIGDEITTVGLFTRFSGKDRNFPIARTGNLAMLPTERIPVKKFDPMEAYLAEGRSIGGLSGSPAWVRQTAYMTLTQGKTNPIPFCGGSDIYFLGLLHGHWDVPEDVMSRAGVEYAEAVNMGISIIVPAHKILEIIYQSELVAMRKKNDDGITAELGPVADSALGERPPGIQTTPAGAEIPIPTQEQFLDDLTKASRRVKPD